MPFCGTESIRRFEVHSEIVISVSSQWVIDFAGEVRIPGLYRITEEAPSGQEIIARWDCTIAEESNDRIARLGDPSSPHRVAESKVIGGLIGFESIDDLQTAFEAGSVYDLRFADRSIRARFDSTHLILPGQLDDKVGGQVGHAAVVWNFHQLDADALFTVRPHELLEAERVTG